MAIFEIVKTIILLIFLFEYFFLLLTLRHNEPARSFASKVATYGYRVMRYLTLNENQRPFPRSPISPPKSNSPTGGLGSIKPRPPLSRPSPTHGTNREGGHSLTFTV